MKILECGDGRELITGDPKLAEVFRMVVEIIGPHNLCVIIEGETGTGKENITRAIHYYSDRRQGPLVAVNCATIEEGLANSELFGHLKGAFTGAYRDKIGLFEQANNGTLFFDEISSLSLENQARLLRVLQEREVTRLGSVSGPIKVDVRIVVASGGNLMKRVMQGTFRRDLYYRLNVANLRLPPLRERRGDVRLLAEHFLERFRRELGLSVERFDRTAMRLLMNHDWPGNVRELMNAIQMAAVEANAQKKKMIFQRHLPDEISQNVATTKRPLFPGGCKPSRTSTRSEILRRLSSNPSTTICALAESIGRDRSVIFRHVSKLEREGLVSIDRKRGNMGSRIHLN